MQKYNLFESIKYYLKDEKNIIELQFNFERDLILYKIDKNFKHISTSLSS